MNQDIYKLLYYYKDEEIGEEGYDLSEVQLLDIDAIRAQKLIKLLDNPDLLVVYEACLILIAWGYKEGFNKFEKIANERWDNKLNFSPNRINGEDNIYDEFSYAFLLATYNDINENELIQYFSKILDLYSVCFFESKLKESLLKLKLVTSKLISKIKSEILLTIECQKFYQASQLLPIISKYDKKSYRIFYDEFNKLKNKDKRIEYNIKEAEIFF